MKDLLFLGGTSFFGKLAVLKLLATMIEIFRHYLIAQYYYPILYLKPKRNLNQQLLEIGCQ